MKYIVFLTLLLAQFKASAQLDTLFWFVAPEVAQNHGDRPIVFRFASLSQPATITISQPANSSFPIQTINLLANDAQTLNLTSWIDIIENKPANTVLPYGFKISASAPIMAYYEVTPTCNCNPDIFTLKGKNSMGTSFIVPAQSFLNNASYARSGFNIVATQNNTTVTINPKQAIVGHAANIPFTIILQKGETFSAEAVSIISNQHLSGSTISSNNPIAVTIHDDSMSGAPYGGCADLMGDQLIPNQVIGSEYIILKGYLNGPDKIYVVATQNNTQISIDGTAVTTINATDTYVHTLSNPTVLIQTSAPTHVLHTTGFGCEVGGAILPSIVCTGSNNVAFVRSTNEFFALNILVPAGGENDFSFNGNTGIITPAMFNFVPGTNNAWKYAQIDASSFVGVQLASRVDNPNFKFHLGVVHGGASSGCRYGYFSDFAAAQYQISVNDQSFCVGEPILLSTNTLTGATYNWTGPNNLNSSGPQLQIAQAQLSDAGTYTISGYLPGTCAIVPDTMDIIVHANPLAPNILSNGPVCEGDSISIWSDTNASLYFWTQGNTSSGLDSLSLLLNPGLFSVSLSIIDQNGCSSPPANSQIQIMNNPSVQYTGPLSVCGSQVLLNAAASSDPSDQLQQINWYQNNQLNYTGNAYNFDLQSTNGSQETFVVAAVSDLGCVATDTFTVSFNPYPVANFTVTPLCDGQTINLSDQSSWIGTPLPGTTVQQTIFPGDGQSLSTFPTSYTFAQSGSYTAIYSITSSAGCSDTSSQSFQLLQVPQILLSSQDTCGQQATFQASYDVNPANIQSFNWEINNQIITQNPTSLIFQQAGTYPFSFTLNLQNGCSYSNSGTISIIPSITFPELIFPNIISTKSSADNNKWQIDPLFENCAEFELQILNRWGQVVFETTSAQKSFAGINEQGETLAEGIYFYLFTSGEQKRHGFIHLVH
jgi:IgGFc binding protein/CHU_C Type IX secretion signal domain